MTNSNEQNLETFLQLSVFPKLRSKEVISLFHDLMRVATDKCSVHQSLENIDPITEFLYDTLQNQLEIIIEETLTSHEQDILDRYCDGILSYDLFETIAANHMGPLCRCEFCTT
jgi:hypothetical protein